MCHGEFVIAAQSLPRSLSRSRSVADALAPTGALRASINLGDAVLTNGSIDSPGGITVDLAHELGARLGMPVELVLWDAARTSVDAVRDGVADVCFLAVDPQRAEELAFTDPYVLIEGAYAVAEDSALRQVADVDREGVGSGSSLALPTTCTSRGCWVRPRSCAARTVSTSLPCNASMSPPGSGNQSRRMPRHTPVCGCWTVRSCRSHKLWPCRGLWSRTPWTGCGRS